MMPWQDLLSPSRARKNGRPWQGAPVDLAGSDYSGPVDGDFVRYVDALMAQAEAKAQAQAQIQSRRPARAPAPAAQAQAQAQARSALRAPKVLASGGMARRRTEVAGADVQTTARSPAWRKLLPFGIWLLFVLTIAFWDGGVFWLLGLLVAGAILFNVVRGKKA